MARSVRLLGLYQMLRGRRAHSVREIAQHFEISVRTAYRDIAELQAGHVTVQTTEHGYRIHEAGARSTVLTDEERTLLLVAISHPAFRRSRTTRKATQRIAEKLADASTNETRSPPPMTFNGVHRSGRAAELVFDDLARAVVEGRHCEAIYDSLSGKTRRRRSFRPIRLFERASAWYVVALVKEHPEPRILRLDRFAHLIVKGRATTPLPAFDLDRWLEDAWDVFKGTNEFDVHLRFDPELRPLIANANHHPAEAISIDETGAIDYRVRVSHLDEIARWVVGFGGQVVVVGPEPLRRRVLELAEGVGRRQSKPS